MKARTPALAPCSALHTPCTCVSAARRGVMPHCWLGIRDAAGRLVLLCAYLRSSSMAADPVTLLTVWPGMQESKPGLSWLEVVVLE